MSSKHLKMNRRTVLLSAGAIMSLLLDSRNLSGRAQPSPKQKNNLNPFQLGVASGDPGPDSVVLWTKVDPNPLKGTNSNLGEIPVQWAIAKDPSLNSVVARGEAIATSEWGYSIHVVADGLAPNHFYWYQFRTEGAKSPIGRTRTLPAPNDLPPQLTFAIASCQNYEHGYYTAYRHMAQEPLDFVLFLGDYIYEGARRKPQPEDVRFHEGPEPVDLMGYRRRYALYRLDPDLQEAHRLFPFICTWDDHEVDNDYANDQSQDFDEPQAFLQRRAAAYQAYYEYMPLRPDAQPKGDSLPLYRHFQFGKLAEIAVLDTRQYRADQACAENGKGGGQEINCPERLDPKRSLLGATQEQWLFDRLRQSQARWNIIAQQYLVAQIQRPLEGEIVYWSNGWDGYPAARKRILDFLARERPANPIFLGGDIHSFWVSELKPDFEDPNSPIVACEFVGTSISSNGPPYDLVNALLPINPHVKFFESRKRGYVKFTVTPERCLSELKAVDTVKVPGGQISTLKRFQVVSGSSQVQEIG